MKMRWTALVALTWTVGCTKPPPPVPPATPPLGEEEAKVTFEEARGALARHDVEGWTPKACRDTADLFAAVADGLAEGGRRQDRARKVGRVSARYDQGLALGRCKLHQEAIAVFDAVLATDPDHARAMVQRALHRLAVGATTVDDAIEEVEGAVHASRYHDGEALVSLARLQMRRGNSERDADGSDDFARARRNLQRALALDDRNLAASNQLAIVHLEQARRGAGRTVSPPLMVAGEAVAVADQAELELAALICSQGLQKDPSFAPLHNTAGLVDVELGRLSEAAAAFGRARALNPRLFEAHMNYAAVNLQFRGFEEAEKGYRDALALRSASYDAQLGLALALRGRASAPGAAVLEDARALIERAKALAPERPEAYFNEAVLVQEFAAGEETPTQTRQRIGRARRLYEAFLARAETRPTMSTAIARAQERIRDIDEILGFLEQG